MILAFAGGVGGAKLANGLCQILQPDELVIAVNTGDDFEHLGLHISPDLDSVMYKLAGINDCDRGWGLADETWQFMDALKRLGGETWFNLGDKDLATHIERTRHLTSGKTLSETTTALCDVLGIAHTIAPMSDKPVRTIVNTKNGSMPFQEYFVRHECKPQVTSFTFDGSSQAVPSPGLVRALAAPDLNAIIICPSNPYVSIDPILSLKEVSRAIDTRTAPVVVVSPIIGGKTIKGPAAKMMKELGTAPSAVAVAAHYGDRLDGIVIDQTDAALAQIIDLTGTRTLIAQTIMRSLDDEKELAQTTIEFAYNLSVRGR